MSFLPTVRVLIVDDNLDDRIAYRRILGKSPDTRFDIREAETGEECLAALADEPDLLLLDFNLPDANGIELLGQLRPGRPHLPVIMLTGLDDVNTSVAALRAGADDYQIKGKLSSDSLLRAIRGALDRHKLEMELENERERLELFYRLVEQSADLLFVVRMPHRQLIEINPAAFNQLGYTREAMLATGADVRKVFPLFDESWAALSAAVPTRRHESYALRADGSRLPIELSASRVRLGDHYFFVGVARDITERQEMEAQLRRLVLLDALTGISNRRALDERFEQEFLRAARGHGCLGLLMIDIDHFKAYNDTYGHQAGDKCLRQVAQALSAALKRPSDFLGRYGGEEFAVLLPDTPIAEAMKTAEMLLARVRELALPHMGSGVGPHVSISIGVAVASPPVRGEKANFMAEADQRLYAAKRAGRNRAVGNDSPRS